MRFDIPELRPVSLIQDVEDTDQNVKVRINWNIWTSGLYSRLILKSEAEKDWDS